MIRKTDGEEEQDSSQAGPGDQAEDEPSAPVFPHEPGPEDRRRIVRILEALLFASPEALSCARLSEVIGVSVETVKDALGELSELLDREERPYELRAHGPGYRLYTRPEFYPSLIRLGKLKTVEKLTPAALETLAIIAYRQPVIRGEIEAIRGVKVGPLLRALLDRKLIRVLGRAEVPGAPLQYGTTQRFLDRFGLKTLSDLPSLKEFKQGRI
ncbi:MAG: SMC-Scp complex subunit ScpB [Planctomycetota bacterium]